MGREGTKMKTKSVTILPPAIINYFSCILLQKPFTSGDSSDKLYEIYKYIEMWLMPKCKNLPLKKEKCQLLIQQFKELHEQAKKKEELKKEEQNKTKMPFYRTKCSKRCNEAIFDRLRFKRVLLSRETSTDNEVSTI